MANKDSAKRKKKGVPSSKDLTKISAIVNHILFIFLYRIDLCYPGFGYEETFHEFEDIASPTIIDIVPTVGNIVLEGSELS